MMNKQGFTLVETAASLVVTGFVFIILIYTNQLLASNKQMVDKMYENTSTFDYITLALLQDVKSSTGSFQVESDRLRLYKSDGTYNEFKFDLGTLYRNNDKICKAKSVDFIDNGNAFEFVMLFEDMPAFELTIYKPQQGYDG